MQPHGGLDRDPRRGGGEERRLAERGEMLGLAVAERVLSISRPLGDSDRIQSEPGGRGVDARVHGLGEDAKAAARESNRQLQDREADRRDERRQRGASRG